MSEVTIDEISHRQNAYDFFQMNFGEPIARVEEFKHAYGKSAATLFWASTMTWNETLLNAWFHFPVHYFGPMMGQDVTVLEESDRPEGSGYMVYLLDEEQKISEN